ncbi:SIS domain-containing protein [Linderina pennispora]|uniref:SIS domain-containing protein n=1 Tax=Linderina pennispora TaxID=61395 RepID=A0A1Y1W7G0_9FUNG|nr:SIS domain-containing protein [Linderina pennispora]ORX69268.1 SIS domain-containing protein [Linderina pennispora]
MPAPIDDLTTATHAVANSLDRISNAIKQSAERLRSDPKGFHHALRILFQTADSPHGKFIFTGVGKSYLIGRKLAATWTSVGSRAMCVHSTEALHGDLGIVSPGDCVIALSYSGNTEEVVRMVKAMRSGLRGESVGVSVVGVGRSSDSPLGMLSDAFIDGSVDGELSEAVSAPTTSSSVTLAIGDAIAMLLMERRQFGPADFARNHPGGNLGRVSREMSGQEQ